MISDDIVSPRKREIVFMLLIDTCYHLQLSKPQPPSSAKQRIIKKIMMRTLRTSATLFLVVVIASQIESLVHATDEESFTSIVISQSGVNFIKDLLITKEIASIIPLKLPKIEKTVKIPFVGNVRMVLCNITIYRIDVPSSYVKPGDSGVVIVASGTTCNLSMNWYYEYSTWLVPVEISDRGRASVQVF